jgi:hypothetical protein
MRRHGARRLLIPCSGFLAFKSQDAGNGRQNRTIFSTPTLFNTNFLLNSNLEDAHAARDLFFDSVARIRLSYLNPRTESEALLCTAVPDLLSAFYPGLHSRFFSLSLSWLSAHKPGLWVCATLT